jgi:hypothetical protein
MINHARTLLLNRSDQKPGFLGEELIPEEFGVLELSTTIETIRGKLFGAAPDRTMLNYRLRQLMTVLHRMDVEEFLLELDSRFTYAIGEDPELFSDDEFDPVVNQVLGIETATVLTGTLNPPDVSGHSQWDLLLDVDTVGETATVTRRTPSPQDTTDPFPIVATGTLTEPIDLGGSGLFLQYKTEGTGPNVQFIVTGISRPRKTMGDLEFELGSIGEENILNIFGIGSPLGNQEPFVTFRNLWRTHPEQPYRVAGMILATIFQIERTRLATP